MERLKGLLAPIENTPFISELDFLILRALHQGETQEEILRKMGWTAKQFETRYRQILECVQALHALVFPPSADAQEPVRALLLELGFHPFYTGVRELETAIRLAQQDPAIVDNLQGMLYPAVAQALDLSPGVVRFRIAEVIRDRRSFHHRNGTTPPFFTGPGMDSHNVNVKLFIRSFLLCLGDKI